MRILRAASVDEIPVGQGKTIEVHGVELAIFNGGSGRYYASSPSCPHEDGPLGDGVLHGDTIICPWHGFDFDVATGACRVDPDLSIRLYPVRVEGTDLFVELP